MDPVHIRRMSWSAMIVIVVPFAKLDGVRVTLPTLPALFLILLSWAGASPSGSVAAVASVFSMRVEVVVTEMVAVAPGVIVSGVAVGARAPAPARPSTKRPPLPAS